MSGRFGAFDGLLDVLGASWPLFGDDAPAPREVSRRLHEVLGVPAVPAVADAGVRVEREWTRDGLAGRELSWDAGFGPRVRGRLLRPDGEPGPLPTALFLHCHGGLKRFGLDKLADGPTGEPAHPVLAGVRADLYGGRAPAEDLARRGYAVLVHDAYGWGSRRLPVEAMPARGRAVADLALAARTAAGEALDEAATYDVHAGAAEDTVAKALALVGTSWAGLIAREDLLALDVLQHLEGGAGAGAALIGLSGGGARAAIASALRPGPGAGIGAVVVAAMVSTLREMVPEHVHSHTWGFMTPSLARVADWPDVVAAAAPRPLHVHYATRDALFPLAGMRRAHDLITRRYADQAATHRYRGVFRDAPHSFDAAAQTEVHDWLGTLAGVPAAGGAR